MTDTRIRDLERQARLGDPAAAEALRAAEVRSRELWSVDPRRDPIRRVLARNVHRERHWLPGFPRDFQPKNEVTGERIRATDLRRSSFGRWYRAAMWLGLAEQGVVVTPWALVPIRQDVAMQAGRDWRLFDGWVTLIGFHWWARPNGRVITEAAAKLRRMRGT